MFYIYIFMFHILLSLDFLKNGEAKPEIVSFHVSLFLWCTLFVFRFFSWLSFFSCTLFMLNSFHVALFIVHSFNFALFSCCTLFMLHSFHVALFHVAFSRDALASCCFFVELFSCCTFFVLHCHLWFFLEQVIWRKRRSDR